ncbi:Guanine nucleotide exchange factor LTE1 [Cyphellophora attinorum]|uniref:Guanine nucleotide exchange factor LTE1 n=1 Tax=Cyphellophora attinorum TaxID=1664694 RepID=A0A0N0NJY8_9EURO|nr:Guanine nucleotide exchange factor LTE1 [Phialophora attinorum]KPI37199.1 Guanine nucleotide exchange factor LTE1 [Phialophora attinorum]
MISDAATSSRASIISLDPAVASQITGTTVTGATSHSRTGSSPYKPGSEHNHGHGHARNKSAPIQNDKHLLRRAKNSTEMLRQRSTKSGKNQKSEPPADSRGGRNFTVGNVGTGGLLYLKPSSHQVPAPTASPPPLMPMTAPADLSSYPDNTSSTPRPKTATRNGVVSPTTRPPLPANVTTPLPARRPTIQTIRAKHGRSQSFSTIDEHNTVMAGRSGALKIVINRPGTATTKVSEDSHLPEKPFSPTLEVPIPHYRLGQPRFSTNGTPALRSSTFTRDSSEFSGTGTVTPQQTSAGKPQKETRIGLGHISGRQIGSSGSDSTIREHIRSDIYDTLADVYDDPDIVRYSHNVREITAATPARLIAQISSESFMDYELVSDFFLTFRSYMTIYLVMDLLLARLRWAINRQEDDGRIIRVRTFAALRHWILNYFADDFIPHQKLRIRFCNEINGLYREVAGRRSTGTSDLKVLRDLKRCWNGRCSLFWNSDDFNVDGDQDEDLLPGLAEDVEGEASSASEDAPPPMPRNVRTVSNSSWFNIPPTVATKVPQHNRQDSGKQESLASEQSLQAKSCNIPTKLLRPGDVQSSQGGSHPVPVQLRRPNANGNLEVKVGHLGHRRGAPSIDSDREPTPRAEPSQKFPLFDGSLIRGSIYAPSAPFVQIISSPTAISMYKFDTPQEQLVKQQRRGSPHSAQSPGVKNIFGSLRKALAGKHGQSDMALVTVSAPMPMSEENAPPRAQLPLNMSKSHDELRSRATALQHKGQLRIDLLCAQVAQNYELLFPHAKFAKHTSAFPIQAMRPATDHGPRTASDPTLLTPDLRKDRLPSHTTAHSGSILIVNDTGMGAQAMPGGLPSQAELRAAYEAQASPKRLRRTRSMIEARPGNQSKKLHFNRQEREHQADEPALPSSSPRPQGSSPARGPGVLSPQHTPRAEPPGSHSPQSQENSSPPPLSQPNGLRRRPGGDLRKVENVQDLPQHQHHESVDTATTSGSPVHSFLDLDEVEKQPVKKQVSMINTHSSQHLRPSFEKAVAGFSHIPDDDDGGLEATLLKLEGRYEKESPPLPQHPLDALERRRSMPEMSTRNTFDSLERLEEPQKRPPTRTGERRSSLEAFDLRDLSHTRDPLPQSGRVSDNSSIFGMPVGSDTDAVERDNSIPMLHRDTDSATTPVLPPAPTRDGKKLMPSPLHLQQGFQEGSYNYNALDPIPRPMTADESAQSFLLDEDENLSDLSSEISVDVINHAPNARDNSPMFAAPGTAVSGLEIPSHPLTYASVVNLAPPEISRDSSAPRASGSAQPYVHLPLPKTMAANNHQYGNRVSGGPAHIPFILAADSQTIAQQMTLIEKSALTEIEWSDLVNMKWDNTSPRVLDWAEYLTKADINGVDLVITRFNLVSRWVRSEIVMTHDIEERAQVITKYIHVAAHARRLHNYATMVQITIGLTSTDATRLTKTWERVPDPDKSLLKNMERLVQPVRNFHELRLEIESADFSDGCIPFIGLYVHDLTYNAQKPATIPRKPKADGRAVVFSEH